ncbi:MutS protein msh4 [Thoreauomyces humboldtii]|nr:MutS protein msh4 [Thoreauomyces humboldtii]
MLEPVKSKLITVVGENLPDLDVVPVSRKYFNDNAGLESIQQWQMEDDEGGFILGLSTKVYCLAAAAALLKYLVPIQFRALYVVSEA